MTCFSMLAAGWLSSRKTIAVGDRPDPVRQAAHKRYLEWLLSGFGVVGPKVPRGVVSG
jgi:hypothetical protein